MNITSIECKIGMIHPYIHRDKFTDKQLDFIRRCKTDRPQEKLAELLVEGKINADDFATGCDFMHRLIHWRKDICV